MKMIGRIYQLIRNKYDLGQWETVWYDPDKEKIVEELPELGMFDLFILNKNGKIGMIKGKNKLQVIAKRFQLYKKYIVIVQLKQKQENKQVIVELNKEEEESGLVPAD